MASSSSSIVRRMDKTDGHLYNLLECIPTKAGRECAVQAISLQSAGFCTADWGLNSCCCHAGVFQVSPENIKMGDVVLKFPFTTSKEEKPQPDFRPISPIMEENDTLSAEWITLDMTGGSEESGIEEGMDVDDEIEDGNQVTPRTSTPGPPDTFVESGLVLRFIDSDIMPHNVLIPDCGLSILHLPHECLYPRHQLNLLPLDQIIVFKGQEIPLHPASVVYHDPLLLVAPPATYGHWSIKKKLGQDLFTAINCLGDAHGQETVIKEVLAGLTYELKKFKNACYLSRVNVVMQELEDKIVGLTSVYHYQDLGTAEALVRLQPCHGPTLHCLEWVATVVHELAHAFSRCIKSAPAPSTTGHNSSWAQTMGALIRLLHTMPHGPALKGVRDLFYTRRYSWSDIIFVWPYAHKP